MVLLILILLHPIACLSTIIFGIKFTDQIEAERLERQRNLTNLSSDL